MSLGPKPASLEGLTPVPPEAFTDAFAKNYPTLLAHLTVQAWDGGEPRPTTTINLFYGEGAVKCWVNERSSGRAACLSGRSVTEVLASIEKHLRDSTMDWRRQGSPNKLKK